MATMNRHQKSIPNDSRRHREQWLCAWALDLRREICGEPDDGLTDEERRSQWLG